jgi:SSS family solute:Na+ symporter
VPTLTLAALILYLAGVLAIGFAWRRRAGMGEASYFVADRSLNTFWGFLGLASLTTGGSTTIALATLVYTHGVTGLWLDLAGALGLLCLGLFFARRVRREGAVTLPEIIGSHYGPAARRVAAVLVLVSEIVWFALLTEGTQVVLTAAFGLEPTRAIVLSTAVFVAYTSLGGQYAVVRTDLLQYGLMVIGIPGIALAAALTRAHGLGGLPPAVWSFPTSSTFHLGDIAGMLVLIGLPHMVGSDVYLKLLSCRDEETARRSALLAAGSKVLFGFSVAAIALAARKVLPPMDAANALPAAVLAFAPPALSALVLVALVATMQTSADIVLLSAAAVTARDLAPALRGGRPLPLAFSRALAPVYGTLGLSTALALDRDVLRTLKLGYSIFAAGLILPTLAAFLPARRRVPTGGAIAAMIAGGATAAAGRFFPALARGSDPVLVGTAVNALVLLTAFVAGRLRPGPAASRGRA